MSLPKWVERYKESVALSPDDFKLTEALSIAWEALEFSSQYDLVDEKCKDAMHRISELGKEK